jgi:hypothetical protein
MRTLRLHVFGPLALLALAGCFDFSALGPPTELGMISDLDGGGIGGGGESDDAGADLAPTCKSIDDCPRGSNCVNTSCQPAVASCAAHKAAFPQAGDGVYWIAGSDGTPHLTYCDMRLGAALCSDERGDHTGKTREGSKLTFNLTSVLTSDGKSCELWALRAADGFPLGVFAKDVPGITLGQCETLGFPKDGVLGECKYGSASGYSNCGYQVTPLYAYGHRCVMCTLNTGTFTVYTKMGPFTNGAALTSFDGSTRASCLVR